MMKVILGILAIISLNIGAANAGQKITVSGMYDNRYDVYETATEELAKLAKSECARRLNRSESQVRVAQTAMKTESRGSNVRFVATYSCSAR
jgi:hypothetical protein